MFGIVKRLNEFGLVGINKRNAGYTLAYNPRNKYPLVDDKLKTKQLAIEAELDVPERTDRAGDFGPLRRLDREQDELREGTGILQEARD